MPTGFSLFFLCLLKYVLIVRGGPSEFAHKAHIFVKQWRYEEGIKPEIELLQKEAIDMTPEEISKVQSAIGATPSGENKNDSQRYICWGPALKTATTTLDDTTILLNGLSELTQQRTKEVVNPMFYQMKVGTFILDATANPIQNIIVLEFEGGNLPEMKSQMENPALFNDFVKQVIDYRKSAILDFEKVEMLQGKNSAEVSLQSIQDAYLWGKSIAGKPKVAYATFCTSILKPTTEATLGKVASIITSKLLEEKAKYPALLTQNAIEVGVGYVTSGAYYLVYVNMKLDPTKFEDDMAEQISKARDFKFASDESTIQTTFNTKTQHFLNWATQEMAEKKQFPAGINNPSCLAFMSSQLKFAKNRSRIHVMKDLRLRLQQDSKGISSIGTYYYNSPTSNYTEVGVALTPPEDGDIFRQDDEAVPLVTWTLSLAFVYENCDPYKAPPETK